MASTRGGSSQRGDYFDYTPYVTEDISEEDVRSMKEVFDALDISEDGKVERSELKSAVLAIGINVDESSTGIQDLTGSALGDTTTGASALDFEGFYRIIAKHKAKAEKFTVDNVFKMFLQLDKNFECPLATEAKTQPVKMKEKLKDKFSGSDQGYKVKRADGLRQPDGEWQRKGCISWKDLRTLVNDLGEQVDDDVLKDMIIQLDHEENGVLGPDDFYNAINHASVLMVESKKHSNPFSAIANPAMAAGMQRSNTGLSTGSRSGISDGGRS
jgi:Ca2+-binding EF-hand superfamily protein